MGGQGGGGGGLSSIFGNMGNQNLAQYDEEGKRTTDSIGAQFLWNILDPGGDTMKYASQFGSMTGSSDVKDIYNDTGIIDQPDKPVIEPIPEDPAIAEAALTEESRQDEMRKRRMRTKTLLSDQGDTGTATVGTKVLLGS
jgi:hypothetical protein